MRRVENKRLTNMVWRGMGEAILLSVLLCGIFLYFMYVFGFPLNRLTWQGGLHLGLTLGSAVVMIGAAYGFWQFHKLNRRLEVLYESMLYLEKGNLARPVPDLGEDEIGRLGEQLGRISRKWEEQVNSLQRLSTNNAQLAEKARFSAVTEERQRLARELHDAVSQQLFAISMTATAVGRTLTVDFDKAQRQIGLIEEMASVAQSEMRALLLHLRPVHLEGKKLSQGLQELVRELSDRVPIDITFEMDDHIRLVKGVEDHLFRIVQEALSNTLRHSRATRMEIRLQQRGDTVKLLIIDNGVGFDLESQKQAAYGLVSMQERVNEIGGAIDLITAPGKGTRIDIRIPVIVEGGEGHV
ncbi:histidine kinase [Paenibacillus swuensis]|uniref:Sensor histidine kinase n=2 Tax=Paenibacillus swuensis TaxID=1178515 RepID=A0A172TNR7_9BACL|nr:histidine kinase [Paenibacillus swuensis]